MRISACQVQLYLSHPRVGRGAHTILNVSHIQSAFLSHRRRFCAAHKTVFCLPCPLHDHHAACPIHSTYVLSHVVHILFLHWSLPVHLFTTRAPVSLHVAGIASRLKVEARLQGSVYIFRIDTGTPTLCVMLCMRYESIARIP